MAYGATTSGGGGTSIYRGKAKRKSPKLSVTKSLNYNDTTNDILLDVSKSASASAQKTGDISHVDVINSGSVPALTVLNLNNGLMKIRWWQIQGLFIFY